MTSAGGNRAAADSERGLCPCSLTSRGHVPERGHTGENRRFSPVIPSWGPGYAAFTSVFGGTMTRRVVDLPPWTL